MSKLIGKIQEVSFGFGGYQDAMIGLSVTLGSESGCWGVCDFEGWWASRTEHCKWTTEDWKNRNHQTVLLVSKLLSDAKVSNVNKLKGIPVEVEFENNAIKSWRILTEVI